MLVARLALLVLACAVGLLLLEVGVRVHGHLEQRSRIRDWERVREAPPASPTGQVTLGSLIRPSRSPDVIYELLPDLAGVVFEGQSLTTNGHGFRGPALELRAPPETLRIVGIGDSVMFGWAVPEEASFLRVLEAMLKADLPETRVEIINMAVPGYNTTMEVASLEEKGLLFEPDVVIIDFVTNDLSLPNFIASGEDHLDLERSFLVELVGQRLGVLEGSEASPALVPAPHHPQKKRRFEDDPARAPAAYRHMVGIDGFRRAMQRLARLGREHDFQVWVTAHGGYPDAVAEICAELGIPIIDVQPRIERYMRLHGIEQLRGSELTVSYRDRHPSVIQHRLIAEAIHAHAERRRDGLARSQAP